MVNGIARNRFNCLQSHHHLESLLPLGVAAKMSRILVYYLCAHLKTSTQTKKGFCVQDKRLGGSERGGESTMGGVSAVCKCMALALAVLIGAAALCNTVTNDVVVATSDAELRISDRGL
jgi:hypothetical protein